MTDLEVAQQTLTNLLQRKLEVSSKVNPDYGSDGESVSLGAYLAQLDQAIAAQRKLIQSLDLFEEHTRGYT